MGGATLEIAFRYRRGGGAVEAEAIERGLEAPQAAHPPSPDLSLTLSAAGVEAVPLRTAGTTPARALIPRERFCALAHGGATIAAAALPPPQQQRLRRNGGMMTLDPNLHQRFHHLGER